MTEQENPPGAPGGGFVERLAQRLGVAADASHVFGAPLSLLRFREAHEAACAMLSTSPAISNVRVHYMLFTA